ncbi:large conductance mechanosensitive channel protein MscL [Sphingobium nicotianae]|uniref:Large-conductance mechanosensitive channel n=1 Tax=Sphingobium nicotianae TaxID=2782607 RepID=A0A9X1DBQ6_9SPHN|nr:large conductance mechanosensitive channel protein MscL [Sphingobium nicotianae]MBT2187142.1 large conductance mechanosensitive channel protein MscL [Sphingobium nicotianae]
MFSEFKTFIARGNVLDLAVGVIIGAAFGAIVKSLTDDLIMPVIGAVTGGIDFSGYFIPLRDAPAGTPHTLAAMKAANVPVFAYGSFITAVINFLILAFIIFLIVRQANKLLRLHRHDAPAGPTEVELLAEIRDALKK